MGWVAVKKNPGVVGDEGRVMVGRMGRVGEESYVRSTVTLRASLYVYSMCVGGGGGSMQFPRNTLPCHMEATIH